MRLAQINVAEALGPLDGPVMAEFMANLDRINALAAASPGYVWRLQDASGNATGLVTPFGPGMITNLTVWDDVEDLRRFTYKTEHAGFIRRRKEWFAPLDGPHMALWWVADDRLPDLIEAKARLAWLASRGPTPHAFTFARAFDTKGLPLGKGARAA